MTDGRRMEKGPPGSCRVAHTITLLANRATTATPAIDSTILSHGMSIISILYIFKSDLAYNEKSD